MRTEKEIYDLVLNFAFQDERIRIVTLEGSRTNVNIPKDNLQDYDITFFVIDMGEFLKSDDWLSVFGNRIMMQKPEDMELFPPEEKGFSYIMLFDDGVKIDLTLLPVSMLEEYLTRDKLVKIMLDKDNMIKTEIVPIDEDYYIKCPTERKFDDCCNEFWNVATYVSKRKYDKEHETELREYDSYRAKLKKMLSSDEKITPKKWTAEKAKLEEQLQESNPDYARVVTELASTDKRFLSILYKIPLYLEG